ncbi:MAG TPA: ATP-binding protein, partial [Ignavibacteriales bacterium]|nr:ATP-binding protein [Ignavibacteriales bacterium]
QGKRYLNIIHEASRKMGTLIDELLSFSRMSRQEFLKTRVDLNAILTDSIQSIMEYNNHSSRKIEWIIKELPVTECDPAMIRIVFNNLISNAVKFTGKKENATIEVGSYEKNRQVIVYVKDNGAGFDMQYSSNLFGVFQRLHRQDEFEGNGIGLATVRRIINRHGGAIWAESRLGEGAAFYFSLPVS